MSAGDRFLENNALVAPSFRNDLKGSSWVYLNGESVDYPTTGQYFSYRDYATNSFVQITTPANPYNLTDSHQSAFSATAAMTAAELAQIDADADLIFRVWFDGVVLVDGFSSADIHKIYHRGTAAIYDLSDSSVISVTGDIPAVWSTLANQQNGAISFKYLENTDGMPIGVSPTTELQCANSDGRKGEYGFICNIPAYSVAWAGRGLFADLDASGVPTGTFTERSEHRLLTHEEGVLTDILNAGYGGYDVDDEDAVAYNNGVQTWADGIVTLTDIGTAAGGTDLFRGSAYGAIDSSNWVVGEIKKLTALVRSSHVTSPASHFVVGATDLSGGWGFLSGNDWQIITRYLEVTSADGRLRIETNEANASFDVDWYTVEDVSEENKYYVNNVEQATVPALPSTTVALKTNDVAPIGPADDVEAHLVEQKIWTDVITEAERLANFNAFLVAGDYVLTDEFDEILLDENDEILYSYE